MLAAQPVRLTEIARRLSVTDPEASRHLGRLSKAGLVAKSADGSYALTPFGRLASTALPPFHLLASRQNYFQSHDLSAVPPELLRRIGELAEHEYLDHLDDVLRVIAELTHGAAQYVWIVADRPVRLEHKHPQPETVSVRAIVPRAFDAEVLSLTRQNWPGAQVEIAYLELIPANLVMNERRACVFFQGLDGRVDLTMGLTGDSVAFHGWCEDFFEHLAGRARKALL